MRTARQFQQLTLSSFLMMGFVSAAAGGALAAAAQTPQSADGEAAAEPFSKSHALAGYAVLANAHAAKETKESHSRSRNAVSKSSPRFNEALALLNDTPDPARETAARSNVAAARPGTVAKRAENHAEDTVIRPDVATVRPKEAVARPREVVNDSKSAVTRSNASAARPKEVALHPLEVENYPGDGVVRSKDAPARFREAVDDSKDTVTSSTGVPRRSNNIAALLKEKGMLARPPMLDVQGRPIVDPFGKPVYMPTQQQLLDKRGRPVYDAEGSPVFQTETELGYDSRGKKIQARKSKSPILLDFTIKDGSFHVDHLPVLAGLNYRITSSPYLYVYAPGFGVVIISAEPFPGAVEEVGAFEGKVLAIRAENHTFEMVSATTIREKGSAYVLIDRYASLPSCVPVIGYGASLAEPYAWPQAQPAELLKCSRKTSVASAAKSGQQTASGLASDQ